MTNKNQKKKKQSQEIAIEIQQSEKEYIKVVEECKLLLEGKGKEVESLKRDIIRKTGRLLEIIGRPPTNRISAKLKRDFKGYISRWEMWKFSDPRWRDPRYNLNPKGTRGTRSTSGSISEPTLSQQEHDYIKAHEDEFKRMNIVDELIELWTGKSFSEQAQISHDAPKGSDWRKKLIEESKDHMLKLAKQMTDSYVNGTLNDMRLIGYITNAFGDILYEERELRDKKNKIQGV